jgi:hypothetical protein
VHGSDNRANDVIEEERMRGQQRFELLALQAKDARSTERDERRVALRRVDEAQFTREIAGAERRDREALSGVDILDYAKRTLGDNVEMVVVGVFAHQHLLVGEFALAEQLAQHTAFAFVEVRREPGGLQRLHLSLVAHRFWQRRTRAIVRMRTARRCA